MQACSLAEYPLSLRALVPEAEWLGADDLSMVGCTCDSRRVKPGDLFAAVRGDRFDGHEFAADAVMRGAAAVLAEHPIPGLDVPLCIVPDSQAAFGRVCQALAGNPSHRLKLIGITGTNGKTTTSCLIAGVLKAAGYRVGVLGTLGYLDGDKVETAPWTTPPADRLAELLARMVAHGCSHAAMEVSSHALAQSRVAGARFDAACVTNVTRDHLDYHCSLQAYRAAKARLFEHLAPSGFAVINADDPVAAGYLRRLQGPALTIGLHADAEITATPLEQSRAEQTFLLTAGNDTIPVRTRMIGTHHIYNCLTAAAVGLAYEIDLPVVVRGLESVEYVPGRLERIECGQPFGVFVDFAHTPDALTGALAALRPLTPGRLICVFGAGGDRDQQKRPLMGRAVECGADVVVMTSDNPRGEDPRDILQDILDGFEQPAKAQTIVDRVVAIRAALAQAQPGDCVLIAGKGHEDYQIIGNQRLPLDDRRIAEEWLYQVKPFATC